jgi:plasmid stability protein
MGRIAIDDVDDALMAALSRRAAEHGVPLEQEARDILSAAVRQQRADLDAELARCRALTPPGPRRLAEELIREDRDSR